MFQALGLRRPGSTAIDVDALRAKIGAPEGASALRALARAICGVLTATVALADPELVIVGGTWGLDPALLDALIGELRQHPRPVPVRAPLVTDHPSLAGARDQALHQLRNTITDAPRPRHV